MTVTSASWASHAADQLGSSYAPGSVDKSQAHSDTFSRMLNEGIRKNKEESSLRPSAHESKARKPENQPKDKSVNLDAGAAKQIAKPVITGKLGISSQQQALAQPDKANSNSKEAAQVDSDSTLAKDGDSIAAEVLSGKAVDTSTGFFLMSMLMRMNNGSAAMPGHAAIKEGDPEEQEKRNEPTDASPSNVPVVAASLLAVESPLGDQPSRDSIKTSAERLSVKGSTEGDPAPVENDASESAPHATQGQLAFALRLNAEQDSSASQPLDARQQSQVSLENASTAPVTAPAPPSINLNSLASGSEKKDHSHSDSKDQGATLVSVDLAAPSTSNPPEAMTSHMDAPAASQASEVEDKLLEYSTETVHNVQMQVVGDDSRRVDVRLMNRAGELRVSVRSGDTALNTTLQSSMPDLTSRLQSAQYQTEVWMPTSSVPSQSSGETSNAGTASAQQQRPGWVADLVGATSNQTERMN